MAFRFFHALSIRNKLILIILFTSVPTLLAGLLAMTVKDIRTFRQDMLNSTILIAMATGNSVVSDLAFLDRQSATETLTKLGDIPSIRSACLFDERDNFFVAYNQDETAKVVPPPVKTLYNHFDGSNLHVVQPIVYQNKKYGTIYLRVSTQVLDDTVRNHVLIMVSLVVVLLGLSSILAWRLQHLISRPIVELTETAKRVSEEGDYSVRVTKTSADEMGTLCEIFNDMLEQIQRRDVDRDRAENELKEARRFLANVIESMPSVLISLDEQGIVTQWNQAAVRMTGIGAHRAMGKSLWDLVPYLTRYEPHCSSVLRNGEPVVLYKDVLQINEERVYFDVSIFPLMADGVSGLVIRADDVTELERKELQLRQAQKMEIVGTLAGGLAHDFNNVLAGIIGTLSLIDHKMGAPGGIDGPELGRLLKVITESANRASVLVQQLLALSRKQEMTMAPVNLNSVIGRITDICRNTLDKSIEIAPVYSGEIAAVEADAAQIEQVLLNLCVNASHAMTIMRAAGRPWGGKLTISVERVTADRSFCDFHPEAAPGYYWKLSVADEGVGMDVKTVAKVFDPFFTTKGKGKGTGLGLAMVYSIVQQHKGFIDVYSEPGTGSAFHVYLPAMLAEQLAVMEPPGEVRLCKGSGLVLVVDDEPVIRNLAQAFLEECGYQVLVAEDGRSAVEIFKNRQKEIRLVLLDMIMPRMSGKEAYIEIKKLDANARVLLASGFRNDERIEEILSSGVCGFIRKPYTLEHLSKVVYDALKDDGA
ncbi:MAG: response regulator [Acidobacteriota bacterium]